MWVKGQSGNPAGRTRNAMSLAFQIRGSAEPAEMVAVALEILRGGTIAEKLSALNWLSANGYQRPAERLEVLTAEVPQIEAQRVLARLSVAAHREYLAALEAEHALPEGAADDTD